MDRRYFLEKLAALGALGVSLDALGAEALSAVPCGRKKARGPIRFDENLVCIISDIHLHPDWHQEKFFSGIVDQILNLNPRPGYVLCLGDIAYLTGKPEEYAAAKRYLDKLEEAGIQLTLTMGNHDRRAEFAEVFPAHAAASQLPDRYVYSVETPLADFILLDTLQEGEDKTTWINPGAIDDRQLKWLEGQLASRTDGKPVFVMAHHAIDELAPIREPMFRNHCCKGFIYGHKHVWNSGWIHANFRDRDVLRTLCVPSTGHWGDIGYVTMSLESGRAIAANHEQEFFFPGPCREGEEKPAFWSEIERENTGAICIFPFD